MRPESSNVQFALALLCALLLALMATGCDDGSSDGGVFGEDTVGDGTGGGDDTVGGSDTSAEDTNVGEDTRPGDTGLTDTGNQTEPEGTDFTCTDGVDNDGDGDVDCDDLGCAPLSVCDTEPQNEPPVIESLDVPTLRATHEGTLSVTASDPDGDALTVTWTVDGSVVDGGVGVTSTRWTPDAIGDHTIEVTVDDGTAAPVRETVTATVESRVANYSAQRVINTSSFPGDLIKTSWDEGFQITRLRYDNGEFQVIMTMGTDITGQGYSAQNDLQAIQTYIEDSLAAGKCIQDLAWKAPGYWVAVRRDCPSHYEQDWFLGNFWPSDQIDQWRSDGFQITALAPVRLPADDSKGWWMIATKGTSIRSQTSARIETWSDALAWLLDRADEGREPQLLVTGLGFWVPIVNENVVDWYREIGVTDATDGWLTPTELQENFASKGRWIHDVTYRNGRWVFLWYR